MSPPDAHRAGRKVEDAARAPERGRGGGKDFQEVFSWISLTPLTDPSLVPPSVVQVPGPGRSGRQARSRLRRTRLDAAVCSSSWTLRAPPFGRRTPIAAMRDVSGVTVLARVASACSCRASRCSACHRCPRGRSAALRLARHRRRCPVSATAEVEALRAARRASPCPRAGRSTDHLLFSPRTARSPRPTSRSAHGLVRPRPTPADAARDDRVVDRALRPTSGSSFAGWPIFMGGSRFEAAGAFLRRSSRHVAGAPRQEPSTAPGGGR